MRWVKHGLVFAPRGDADWMVTHAAPPTALHLEGDRFRIFCSGRDREGSSQTGFFDIDITDPTSILRVSRSPVIGLGPLGAHDDRGAMTSWITRHEGKLYHYYSGWSLGRTVPFYISIGLAVSEDGGETFHKVSPAPILGRHRADPYLVASPCVLVEDGRWRMWYVSGVRWVIEDGAAKHFYNIRYAESDNGIDWQRNGIVCIDFRSPEEYALGRPSVLRENGALKMWYPYRGAGYRIGYAESQDGTRWIRRDERGGIEPSSSGWDSEMVTYPYVFDHRGVRYMLYNGNGYGKTGIGLASCDEDP